MLRPSRYGPILAALALLLSACAQIRPAGPAIDKPHFAGPEAHPDAFIAADGARLPMREWLPSGKPRAVILALHGMNDYSEAFDDPGRTFADDGFAVYAYDQRGFGRAPDHGYWAGTRTLVADADAAALVLAARYPHTPLYLLGESMGGAVAMLAAETMPPPHLAGLILAAPAVWDRGELTFPERALLWIADTVTPGLRFSGSGLGIWPSDNIAMLRRLSHDPLIIKRTRVDAINGLVDLMSRAAAAAPDLRVPALILYGERDRVVPAKAFWRMVRHLPDLGHGQVIGLYPLGYHMLLRDLEAGTVMHDIASWIDHPSRPLPSGAEAIANARLARMDLRMGRPMPGRHRGDPRRSQP